MTSEEFKEIMETLQHISIQQAVMQEKLESVMRKTDKESEIVEQLEKSVQKHDTFMKISIWLFSALISIAGVNKWFWH